MDRYADKEFEKQVDKAYDILWEMYRPLGNNGESSNGCEWNREKEEKLFRMINIIDNELGR